MPGRQTLVAAEARRWESSFVSRDLADGGVAPDAGAFEPALAEAESSGEALPVAIAARMREVLDRDVTHVRVHVDAAAARAATAIGARAFTLGHHIYFNRGQFTPETPAGERLLVHELTHVAQHDEGRLPHGGDGLRVSDPSSAIEREARAAEDRASAPRASAPTSTQALASPARASTGRAGGTLLRAESGSTDAPQDQVAFVREEGLNLRAAPAQTAAALRQLKFGQRVHLLEPASSGGWVKVAVLGQTGYVYQAKIHSPPKELIAKDPGLRLVRVAPGQTFWGLVKESYGIQGNESTKDQNIDHFINAIRAVNKPEAFTVKAGWVDRAENAAISGRDASNTQLHAGVDLWIPSFGVAAQIDVGSGTVRGEVSRTIKKIQQKLHDFGAACHASGKHIPGAIVRNAGEIGAGMLHGLIDFAKDAAKILATSTAIGALIGALFGGVGAIPGAEIGFEIGLMILEAYGLFMLVEAILGVAGKLVGQLGKFVSLAWQANGDEAKIEKAGEALADALGILVAALLVVVAAYLLKRGAKALSKTKFAKTVGETELAKWFADRGKMKTGKEKLEEKLEKEKLEKEKLEKEKLEKEKLEKEKLEKEKLEKEKLEKEKLEKEKLEKEKLEKEKLEKEKLEKEKLEKEKLEKEKLDAEAKRIAKVVTGNVEKKATTKYQYESQTGAVEAKVNAEARAAAEQAYRDAIKDGKAPDKAQAAAQKAAKEKAESISLAEAKRVAHEKAREAVANRNSIDTAQLDPKAQTQLTEFGANRTAAEAKRISGELAGSSKADFTTKMGQEVSAGKCTKKTVNISGPPPQPMDVYEYPDGTVVRFKPLGDAKYNPGPGYSVEVKTDPRLPDRGPEDAAFKVDPAGTAVPRGPFDVKNPYPPNTAQYDAFVDAVMKAGHHALPPP